MRRQWSELAHVAISQSGQTVRLTFNPPSIEFTPERFRVATAEANVEVLTLDVEVCGLRAGVDGAVLIAGASRVRVSSAERLPDGVTCVTGRVTSDDHGREWTVTAVNTPSTRR